MVSDKGFVGTLQADFGLGKSYFATEVVRLLKDSGVRRSEIFHYQGLEIDDGNELISWLDNQLNDELKPSLGGRLWKIFTPSGMKKIAKGLAADAAAFGKAQKTVDAIAEVMDIGLSNVAKPSDAERLGARIRALKSRLERSHNRYYLVVEDIQKTPSNSMRALRELIQMQAPNVRIFLTLDPKRYLKREGLDLKSLKTELQKFHADAISALSQLTGAEIGLWYAQKTRRSLSREDEALAAEISGGSPTVIKSWLESGSQSVADIVNHTNRVWGQYDESFESLSNNAKNVISLLASAETSVRTTWLSNHFGLKPGDWNAVLQELGDLDLVALEHHRIQCKNRNWISFLRSKLSDANFGFNRICLALEEFSAIRGYNREEKKVEKVVQLISSGQAWDQKDIDALLSEIHDFLHNGYYEMAEKILNGLSYADLVSYWAPANKVEYATLKSDLAGEYGNYDEAIKWAEEGLGFCETNTQKIPLQIDIGDKYLQRAIHDKALISFRDARRAADTIEDLNAFVKSSVRTLKLAFDRERYETCQKVAGQLIEKFKLEELQPRNRCLTLRWMARIYAVSIGDQDERDKALRYAQDAREIAVSQNNFRDIGNCDFVLGEVYRQSNQTDAAVHAYREALGAARDSGNKDLEAYSLLGMCVLHAALDDWEKVLTYLGQLELCLDYHAPIEQAYFDLLSTAATMKKTGAVDQAALDQQLGTLWGLKKRRHTGRAEIKNDPTVNHARVLQQITWAFPL